MEIKGLTMTEISQMMKCYVEEYFKDKDLSHINDCIFEESYLFEFQEISHVIPSEYHYLFKDTDMLNGASGIITVGADTYTLTLISSEFYDKVYFLCLQVGGYSQVLKDFICT